MNDSPTHVWVETATGRSAVAVVVVAGPTALQAVEACFLAAKPKPLGQTAAGVIRFGRWGSEQGEEVVVVPRSAQQPTVEIHCHGGRAASRAVLNQLCQQGCIQSDWQTAWQQLKPSQLAWDAQQALLAASTERTAAIALDQVHGAMQQAVERLLAEEDATQVAMQLEPLLHWAPIGKHVAQPWKVVLTGAPNAGKSSLINAILGFERVVVFDQPGTTRDVVWSQAAVDGWPVSLCDTAGLRNATDDLEAEGVRLAQQAIDRADLVIEVKDTTGPVESPHPLPDDHLVVWNKTDLAPAPVHTQLATSTVSGEGIGALLQAISLQLAPSCPPEGAAVPLTSQQETVLQAAATAAQAGDLPSARQQLQSLLARPWQD